MEAIELFDQLLKQTPSSPRALYGKALALDTMAEQKRSNQILQNAIDIYVKVLLNTNNVLQSLMKIVADRTINRLRFLGKYRDAIRIHRALIDKHSNEPQYRNELAITYLLINRIHEARHIFEDILKQYPNNGVALVHYGFILKINNNLAESITYLTKGLATKDAGVIDGRFYFHLGDAYSRLGQRDKSLMVYQEAVDYKLFRSIFQRSLYNVDYLKGQPWWDYHELPYSYQQLIHSLETNWKIIRDEGLAVLLKPEQQRFEDESENLRASGTWQQFELFARGSKNVDNCNKCPFVCNLIEQVWDASHCKRGQAKLSVMQPNTHVWPHCGPTNCRLRMHLGLVVPKGTSIRVAEQTRNWEEGKVFIFDDSFEHEVWHNGSEFRLVLIVDVWHPELTKREKMSLTVI